VAAQLHDPGPVILCWILGGVIALFGALTIAELAGALPRSGGIFAYLLESFGRFPRSCLVGQSWLSYARLRSALPLPSLLKYLGYFLPMSPLQVRYVAAVAIVLIGLINYIGVQRAAVVMTFATVAKYIAVIGFGRPRVYGQHGRRFSIFWPAWGSGCTSRCWPLR